MHEYPEEDSDKGGKMLLENPFDKERPEYMKESFEEKKKQKLIKPPKKIMVLTLAVEETPKTEAELQKEEKEKAEAAAKPGAPAGPPTAQEN